MNSTPNEFEQAAGQRTPTLVEELVSFFLENKKWWLIPIVLVMALFGFLALFAGSGAAPFIYTLF